MDFRGLKTACAEPVSSPKKLKKRVTALNIVQFHDYERESASAEHLLCLKHTAYIKYLAVPRFHLRDPLGP